MTVTLRKLEGLRVTLTVARSLRFRMWLGVQIIKLGARVFGAAVSVDRVDERP